MKAILASVQKEASKSSTRPGAVPAAEITDAAKELAEEPEEEQPAAEDPEQEVPEDVEIVDGPKDVD